MNSHDEPLAESGNGIPALPSVQERRMQLEAFQAAKALNKSLRGSVRGVDRAAHPTTPLNRSVFRPTKSVFGPTSKSSFANDLQPQGENETTREQLGAQDNDAVAGLHEESLTRKIIQHFDALSRANKPSTTHPLLGVRRQGAAIEKKTIFSKTLRATTTTTHRHQDVVTADNISLEQKSTPPLTETRSGVQQTSCHESKLNLLGTQVYPTSSRHVVTSTPKPVDFSGTKSIRRDRSSTLAAPGKRQEEIYLSQARLLQWYTISKRTEAHFQEQEKSAQAQFELVGRSILEKQEKLKSLQQRFEVEKELIELESTLGHQRDQLMDVVIGLDSFKDSYEAFSSALDRESNVLSIPSIDDRHLGQWLHQIQACQSVVEIWSRDSAKNTKLLQGIAQVMKSLCDIVKQEIQEFMECMALLTKTEPRERPSSCNIPEVALPVRELLEPSTDALDVLSNLSLEQISAMEDTLRRVKMNKLQSSSGVGVPGMSTGSVNHQGPQTADIQIMKRFMSVMDSTPKKIAPTTAPSIKLTDGVPWLTFGYSTKGGASMYTVRVDIDTVEPSDISPEFRKANCLYPSADGPDEEYKGTRREYERACNEQGWKLAHLNPTLSGGKKGVLQRAVVSLRNTSSEQRSRRSKRHEKAAAEGTLRHRSQDIAIASPRLPAAPQSFQQTPNVNPHNDELLTRKPPSLGSFQPSPQDSKGCLEFEGFVDGRLRKLRINHNIEHVDVNNLSFDFKQANCVYPRSCMGGGGEGESEHWKSFGVRQAEESYLNEIGWKLRLAQLQPHSRNHKHQQGARFDDHSAHQNRSIESSHFSNKPVKDATEDEQDEVAKERDDDVAEEEEEEDSLGEESDEGSSSSEDGSHSQMSLLSFTGRIRTYSLGTGSGSARSRPRIKPRNKSFLPLSSTAMSKKRSLAESQKQSVSRSKKRTRQQESESEDEQEEIESHENQRVEGVVEEGEGTQPGATFIGNEADTEEEDDWWMSRLQNSAYPEDHNFVSMSTEELISALTTGYNSDMEDEDEESEDDGD
ncbi:hypothetical protein BGZ65_006564 [Modicella reniformis]|uniref:DUF8032 domain-containing protein n=1 Tax=Modicella reniformis TaxID=1440133 RepID=A0A9P6SV65_9FUNG|nr:hypothetical protein BGZ65_006564 [Modicella reniformis]